MAALTLRQDGKERGEENSTAGKLIVDPRSMLVAESGLLTYSCRVVGARECRKQLPSWALFFVIAPLVLAGFVPWWVTQWEFRPAFFGVDLTRILVVTGLYRYVRNPIYIAVVAVIFGQALLFGDWRLLWYGALLGFFHVWVLMIEEPTLKQTFGTEYESFRTDVPRWIPRLTPWRAA
jgi:protein-S-isoprenylcysteine O-methyltransferase Ste14